jgi:23S rRNA-/tRNA-specific pseudouridylate synthase
MLYNVLLVPINTFYNPADQVKIMQKSQENFKAPPKRFQPHGLSILYEDRDILVVDKVNGLLTVSNKRVRENTALWTNWGRAKLTS